MLSFLGHLSYGLYYKAITIIIYNYETLHTLKSLHSEQCDQIG